MFYKNAILFTIPFAVTQAISERIAQIDSSGDGLQRMLEDAVLKPVGPMELASAGLVSPYGEESNSLYQRVQGDGLDVLALALGTESRILPAAAVNNALQKKLKAFEEQNARKPGGRMRRQLKEDLVAEMLPKAFIKPGRLSFYIDLKRGLVVADTSSRKAAEQAISVLRHALGSFPALPINAETSPEGVMTGWIAGEPLPEQLGVGDECQLQDPAGSATVRCQHQDLSAEEVTGCLEAGKRVVRLGLSHADAISAVVGSDLVIRKIKFLDGAVESLESSEREDLNAELDARMLVMGSVFGAFLDVLAQAFKLTKAE